MTGSVTPINDLGNALKATEEALVEVRDLAYQVVDQLVDERTNHHDTVPVYNTGQTPTITGDNAVANRVDELLALGPGWDGHAGTPQPAPHAVYQAAELCRKLDMLPLPDGSVEIRLGDYPVCQFSPTGEFTATTDPL